MREVLTGTIDGTNGSDGNATFTIPSGNLPIGELVFHDSLYREPGIAYASPITGPTIQFLPPYIPIAGSPAPIIVYTTSVTAIGGAPATTVAGFDYTASGLLAAVRDITNAGTSQADWPDPDLLRLINREINGYLVPFVLDYRKEFFSTFQDQPLIGGRSSSFLPSGAVGGKLRAAEIVGPPFNLSVAPLVEVPMEQGTLLAGQSSGMPTAYYFSGNKIVLVPAPSDATYSLRLHYPQRPSTLVLPSACVRIDSLVPGAAPGSFRLGLSGSVPGNYSAGAYVDLVQGDPSFDVLLSSAVLDSTPTTIDILGTQPADLQVGDWICQAGTAPVVTAAIPDLVMGILVKKVAMEVMSTKGDNEAFGRLRALKAEDEQRAKVYLRRRNEGNSPRIGIGNIYRFKYGGYGY